MDTQPEKLPNQEFLERLKQELNKSMAQYHELFASPSFKRFIENYKLVTETVEKTIKPVMPILKQRNKAVKLITDSLANKVEPQEIVYVPSKKHIDQEEMENMATKIVEKILKKVTNNNQQGLIITLAFNDDNNLIVKNQPQNICPIQKNSVSYRILIVLEHKYTNTKSLTNTIKSGSIQSTSKTIAEINRKARYHLKLMDKLIESKRGEGYRINPKYTIEKSK